MDITSYDHITMFAGQGSQFRGMGKNLFSEFPDQTLLASEILGYDIEELCIKDPKKQLIQTQFTQPALYVVNAFQLFKKKELKAHTSYYIGHSLGEYNALLAAGAFNFETGLKLVKKRGELMAQASGGAMTAVIGVAIDYIVDVLREKGFETIDIANYNTPMQTVLSGPKKDIMAVVKHFEHLKVRAIPLAVSAPFHSRYMNDASNEFADFLESFSFNALSVPVIANATAKPYDDSLIASTLATQISSSVKWHESIKYLLKQGFESFNEIGSTILTKMVKDIKADYSANNPTTLSDHKPSTTSENEEKVSVESKKVGQKITNLNLGSLQFKEDYKLKYTYAASCLSTSAASPGFVTKMAKAGLLSFLSIDGLQSVEMDKHIQKVRSGISTIKGNFGVTLQHNLYYPEKELETIKQLSISNIDIIEARGYLGATLALVYFRLKGLSRAQDGLIHPKNKIIVTTNTKDVAREFMNPAPLSIVKDLVNRGLINNAEAELSQHVPLSNDIAIKLDTVNRANTIFEEVIEIRKEINSSRKFTKTVRIGISGTIATPNDALLAYQRGADFILTDAVNDCTVESALSDQVKELLQDTTVDDIEYAPVGENFELGIKAQVLNRGVSFPDRAKQLYTLHTLYHTMDEIPQDTLSMLEKNVFCQPLDKVWQEVKIKLENNGDQSKLSKALKNPKYKMILLFQHYFKTADQLNGLREDILNKCIRTNPAISAFNQWVKDTPLESWKNRHADEIGIRIMKETEKLMSSTT